MQKNDKNFKERLVGERKEIGWVVPDPKWGTGKCDV
jgi:hypothetical protein